MVQFCHEIAAARLLKAGPADLSKSWTTIICSLPTVRRAQLDTAMAEFSPSERLFKAVLGPALLSAWWYYAPDYSKFFSTSLGKLTLGDIGYHLSWILLLLLCIYHTISWLYEACTGRDSIWLWHRD